ncbi:hypothetical protein bcgnr5380_47030 [Bacillus cereus]
MVLLALESLVYPEVQSALVVQELPFQSQNQWVLVVQAVLECLAHLEVQSVLPVLLALESLPRLEVQ